MTRAVGRRLFIFAVLFVILFLVVRGSFVLATASFGGRYGVYDDTFSEKEYTLTAPEMVWETLSTGNLSGRSVRFEGNENDVEELKERLRLSEVMSETVGGIKIIYGYTNAFVEYKLVSGKKVNVQIAVSAGTVTVGVPLIMGSY